MADSTPFERKRYRIPKSTVFSALGITGQSDIYWQGSGPESEMVVIYPATITSGPVGSWETETVEGEIYAFVDLRAEFLAGVPLERFVSLSASFDSTYLWFDLGES